MKILIITEYFPSSAEVDVRGGVEARAFYIAKELAKKHKVSIITSREPGQKEEARFAGIKVYRVGKERTYTQSGSFTARLNFMFSAMKKGKELKVDIVDGYSFLCYPAAIKIADYHGIPAVATYHDVWVGEWINNIGITGIAGELLERYTLWKNWDHFIAVSNFTKKNLVKVGIPYNDITVVYNGVDLAGFKKLRAKKQDKICYVGRLVDYKQVDTLIRALKLTKKVKLEIIGTGPERPELERLVRELRLQDRVEFRGFVDKHEDVIKALKSAKLFSLPSLVEGFGMVTIEGAATGTPYVNSRIPPTVEITHNGQGGLLFKPGSYKDLAENLNKLLSSKRLYEKKQKEAIELAESYDWRKLAKQVEEVYKKVIAKPE
ncbi:glycosyltransferase family 4 protein [Nanoarchaeota archaeon]